MKVFAYEVRPDSLEYMQQYIEGKDIQLAYTDQPATIDNVHLAAGYDAVTFLGMLPIDDALIDAWSKLGVTFMSTRTVGTNHIDIASVHAHGMHAANVSYPPNGVAEFTIMLMLITLRHYKPAMWRQQVNDYSLTGLEGSELGKKTVGIVGCGRIGSAVAQCLTGFGCRIVAYDPHPEKHPLDIVEYLPLDEVYAQSDIVSLHIPLTQDTEHMINGETLANMKDGVIIINCARGALCDNDALIEGIESGKIGALGIDVIEGEEGIAHLDHRTTILRNQKMAYLRQFPNVVMTQHMAFHTDEDAKAMAQNGIAVLEEMASGKPCRFEL